MAEGSPKGWKTLWEKEKLLVTSNFSFSCSVFKRLVLQTRKNQGLLGKGYADLLYCRSLLHKLFRSLHNEITFDAFTFEVIADCMLNLEPFTTQSQLLTTLGKKALENILGKGENAGNQHFLLFPKWFLPFQKQISVFELHLFCGLQVFSIWTGLKFCRLVKS